LALAPAGCCAYVVVSVPTYLCGLLLSHGRSYKPCQGRNTCGICSLPVGLIGQGVLSWCWLHAAGPAHNQAGLPQPVGGIMTVCTLQGAGLIAAQSRGMFEAPFAAAAGHDLFCCPCSHILSSWPCRLAVEVHCITNLLVFKHACCRLPGAAVRCCPDACVEVFNQQLLGTVLLGSSG
jgi:hypothetical protein